MSEENVETVRSMLEPFKGIDVASIDLDDDGLREAFRPAYSPDFELVPTRQWATGSASGARVELQITFLYELRDGQITRLVQYDTLEEAREAAGLRE